MFQPITFEILRFMKNQSYILIEHEKIFKIIPNSFNNHKKKNLPLIRGNKFRVLFCLKFLCKILLLQIKGNFFFL